MVERTLLPLLTRSSKSMKHPSERMSRAYCVDSLLALTLMQRLTGIQTMLPLDALDTRNKRQLHSLPLNDIDNHANGAHHPHRQTMIPRPTIPYPSEA